MFETATLKRTSHAVEAPMLGVIQTTRATAIGGRGANRAGTTPFGAPDAQGTGRAIGSAAAGTGTSNPDGKASGADSSGIGSRCISLEKRPDQGEYKGGELAIVDLGAAVVATPSRFTSNR